MRPFFAFFLFLFFQLLGGHSSSLQGAHTSIRSHSLLQPAKGTQELHDASRDFIITNPEGSAEESIYSVSAEDRDEDDELIKKQTVAVKQLLAFSYQFISHYFYRGQKFHHSSGNFAFYSGCPKYIAQRVLRI